MIAALDVRLCVNGRVSYVHKLMLLHLNIQASRVSIFDDLETTAAGLCHVNMDVRV